MSDEIKPFPVKRFYSEFTMFDFKDKQEIFERSCNMYEQIFGEKTKSKFEDAIIEPLPGTTFHYITFD